MIKIASAEETPPWFWRNLNHLKKLIYVVVMHIFFKVQIKQLNSVKIDGITKNVWACTTRVRVWTTLLGIVCLIPLILLFLGIIGTYQIFEELITDDNEPVTNHFYSEFGRKYKFIDLYEII